MKNLPPELAYILIFGAFVLFQLLVKRFAKRRQSEVLEQTPLPEEEPIQQEEALPEIWGRSPVISAVAAEPVERVDRSQAPIASATIAPRRSAARAMLGSRHDLRRTIVIMSILGPCRAMDPAGNR